MIWIDGCTSLNVTSAVSFAVADPAALLALAVTMSWCVPLLAFPASVA